MSRTILYGCVNPRRKLDTLLNQVIVTLMMTAIRFHQLLLLLLLLLLNLFTNNSPSAYLLLLKGLFYKNINQNKI